MPNPEANENNNTQRTLAGAGIGAAVSAGAAVGATAAYVSAPVAAVAAPAVGAGAAAAAAAGAGTAAGAAVWGAAAAIPSLVGFGSGGIAAGSWGAWLMSTSAIANGGGVAAGGLVATGQSIGAVGLAAVTGPAIVATGAVVAVSGYVLLKRTAGAAAATSIWMSPAVLAGVRVIAGATAGAGVGWILCWLVGEAIRYRTFDDKDDARKAFDESPASNKVLIDPEEMVVESSDITIYSEEKKWILHELCAEAGDPDGKIRLRFFDGKDDARKAFDDSSASNKVLLNFAENVLLQFPAMPSSE
ncbi:hypothetical protein PHYBOEH_004946 [Phytophthora boehmeriae]|uniref:Uncharacterized protein n=1 Tax=Phytophthora boehmeriae TaxID=109152 RepID=A0A8T1WMK6_9STRA|nr:hypothetical protein PHYBOEH_004946 [Phytophthora boehmeriae]